MKTTQTRAGLVLGAVLLGLGGAAQATLINAGNGLVNDTVLNITWVANAGLSNEQLSGPATWQQLVTWADTLVYGGYDDWRLASMSVAGGLPTGSASSVVELLDRDRAGLPRQRAGLHVLPESR